ncbi:MAG: tyrosine-type recombinase/integrase [Candidatus Promineifilaceae bacterium]
MSFSQIERYEGGNSAEMYHAAIANSGNLLASTKEQYRRAIDRALEHEVNLSDALSLQTYAQTLATSSAYYLRGALHAYAKHVRRILESQVTPETYQQTAAAIMRLNALATAIEPPRGAKGQKVHLWLKRHDVAALLQQPDISKRQGLRDWALLALLVGAGLRREEAVNLMWSDVLEQGRRAVLQVRGKGNKNRIVPLANRMVGQLDLWRLATGGVGFVVRRVRRGDHLQTSGITVRAVNQIVTKYGALIGSPKLQPHDLRRTYAQVGLDNGITIQQISVLLGHSSILVTQTYLNIQLDLESTISDFIPF